MVVLGKSEKGLLFPPELTIKLPYHVRDVVFLRSQVLEHFNQAFEGLLRYVLVFTIIKVCLDIWRSIIAVRHK